MLTVEEAIEKFKQAVRELDKKEGLPSTEIEVTERMIPEIKDLYNISRIKRHGQYWYDNDHPSHDDPEEPCSLYRHVYDFLFDRYLEDRHGTSKSNEIRQLANSGSNIYQWGNNGGCNGYDIIYHIDPTDRIQALKDLDAYADENGEIDTSNLDRALTTTIRYCLKASMISRDTDSPTWIYKRGKVVQVRSEDDDEEETREMKRVRTNGAMSLWHAAAKQR